MYPWFPRNELTYYNRNEGTERNILSTDCCYHLWLRGTTNIHTGHRPATTALTHFVKIYCKWFVSHVWSRNLHISGYVC